MSSDAANRWTEFYTKNSEMMYPAEAVIRIFKGTYPNLTMPKPKPGQSVLDVGCGDGRHFPLFHELRLRAFGTEITDEICQSLADRMSSLDISATFSEGTCAKLPWLDPTFDYLLTWNSCYYMNTGATFEEHVAEMARVIKPGGWIVCSMPKLSCFIYNDAEHIMGSSDWIIRNDHFGLRNGETLHCSRTPAVIEVEFGDHFTNFCHASIDIDMFGLAYHWHVFVADRRS
jgi:SAM-dependent methyltransferase